MKPKVYKYLMDLRGHLKPIGLWVRRNQQVDDLSIMTLRNSEIKEPIEICICGLFAVTRGPANYGQLTLQ